MASYTPTARVGVTRSIIIPWGMWLWEFENMSNATGTGWSWRRFGFAAAAWDAAYVQQQSPNRVRLAVLPDWFLIVMLAIFPLSRLWRQSRQRHRHVCRECGYDLRATPDKCPECDTPVRQEAEANS